MAIASAVFWIMIGIGYIVYQCYKEHKIETLIVISSVAVVLVGSLLLYALSMPFSEVDPILGQVFLLIVYLVGLYFLLRKKKADEKKASDEREKILHQLKKDAALRKLAAHLDDSDKYKENVR